MYKLLTLLCLLFCTLTQYGSSLKPWLEVKPSYFLFTAAPMKQVYNKGGFEIQTSASGAIANYLDLYGSIGYRKAHGYALNTYEKTTLTVVPFDIGLKPIFNLHEHFYYFLAIGPRFLYFNQHNDSQYVDPVIKGGAVGLFVNTGFNVLLKNHLLFGIFGEYSYEKKTIYPTTPNVFSNGKIQIGGFAIGASIGYAF